MISSAVGSSTGRGAGTLLVGAICGVGCLVWLVPSGGADLVDSDLSMADVLDSATDVWWSKSSTSTVIFELI